MRLSRGPLLVGAGLAAVALVVVIVGAFAWPSISDAPSPVIDAGDVDEFAEREPILNDDGRFWVVKLESGGFLALYEKDPHLGCADFWNASFEFQGQVGWFTNSCHRERYDVEGNWAFGPAPRGMDRFPVEIVDDRVLVDTSQVICGPGAPEGMVCSP